MDLFLTKQKLEKRVRELEGRRYIDQTDLFPFVSCEDAGGPDTVRRCFPGKISGPLMNRMDIWAGLDRYLWMQKEIKLPEARPGCSLVGLFDFGKTGGGHNSGFESLLYINGKERQGVDSNHSEVWLDDLAGTQAELTFMLWSGLEGSDIFHEKQYHQLRTAKLAFLHETVNELYYQSHAVMEALEVLEPDSETAQRLLQMLDRTFLLVDWDDDRFLESAGQALEFLREALKKEDKGTQVTVHCVGHTHIDVAWLWRTKHTREKAIRSFATALELMKEFPEFKFLQSQPQLYDWIKEDAPEVYKRMQEASAAGQWEPEGGMWLEADCNIPSGESLARQFLYGCRLFEQEFGKKCRYLWLPDVFGYSWALPQILKQCGIETFATTKISWNQYNRMPHDVFWWRGIDGSEILTCFLTTPRIGQDPKSFGATYNGYLKGETVLGSWKQFQDKQVSRDVLISYGYGDGGGGVTRDMIQIGKALDLVPGMPKVKFDTAGDYFEKLHENVRQARQKKTYVHTWDGELYLELHRGTYTAQANNKKWNRKLEQKLKTAEWLSVWRGAGEESREKLREAWKIILRNQFHDIIPGSSIHEVYEDSDREYREADRLAEEVCRNAGAQMEISSGNCGKAVSETAYTVYYPGSFRGRRLAVLPVSVPGAVFDSTGKILPSQKVRGGLLTEVEAGALSVQTVRFVPGKEKRESVPFSVDLAKRTIETPFYTAVWGADGRWESLYDRRAKREVLDGAGNSLDVYEDKAVVFDAWDVDIFYREKKESFELISPAELEECGELRAVLKFSWRYRNSRLEQRVVFYANSRRIDFETEADWHENHRLLKAAFPVRIRSTKASYEIQYGYLERPTHWNTSWDQAKFEVCGHRFADLSQPDYGVALLNDCKYGYSIKDQVMELSLLKSSKNPDETADMGKHQFTYSLYPHEKALADSDVFAQAEELNNPAFAAEGKTDIDGLFELESDGGMVDCVKHAEDGNGVIVRCHECRGKNTEVRIYLNGKRADIVRCNLLEEPEGKTEEASEISTVLKPFEIRSYRIVKKD